VKEFIEELGNLAFLMGALFEETDVSTSILAIEFGDLDIENTL
jgi:hypothetical protein